MKIKVDGSRNHPHTLHLGISTEFYENDPYKCTERTRLVFEVIFSLIIWEVCLEFYKK